MATRTVPVIPPTFKQALVLGYQVSLEKSTTHRGKRAGTLVLTKGREPKLTVTYCADRGGYVFGQPEAV